METYIPSPLDTQDVELPETLGKLTEQMARNVHEVWAQGRLAEGWTWGEPKTRAEKVISDLVVVTPSANTPVRLLYRPSS